MKRSLRRMPTVWGLEEGHVTIHLPEEGATISIEEATDRARNGDRQAAYDCIQVWRSIELGGTPAAMPLVLRAFVSEYLDSLGELGKRPVGDPGGGRDKWIRDRRLWVEFEEILAGLQQDSTYKRFSPKDLEREAIGWLADRHHDSAVDTMRKRLHRGKSARGPHSIGMVLFDEEGQLLDTGREVVTED